jgi:hypothetical protein
VFKENDSLQAFEVGIKFKTMFRNKLGGRYLKYETYLRHVKMDAMYDSIVTN